MRLMNLLLPICLAAAGFAQEVHFDYDRSTNFGMYKTYQWIDFRDVPIEDQILDRDIKRSVDAQLAGKGLRRVDSGGDLLVGYKAAISQEKQFNSLGGWGGPGAWIGPWGGLGNGTVTTSTIDVGKLIVGIYDPAKKQLVWRGSASKTLDIKNSPEKNYRNLEKAMAKLFKSYPPGSADH